MEIKNYKKNKKRKYCGNNNDEDNSHNNKIIVMSPAHRNLIENKRERVSNNIMIIIIGRNIIFGNLLIKKYNYIKTRERKRENKHKKNVRVKRNHKYFESNMKNQQTQK